jgi:hypothetical protein
MNGEARTRHPKRTFRWRIEEVEISWLPIGETAFLLWVLVLLIAVWFGVCAALGAL